MEKIFKEDALFLDLVLNLHCAFKNIKKVNNYAFITKSVG
jgi:hypothetical protein